MIAAHIRFPKILCDFAVAAAMFLSSVSPVIAGNVKAPSAGVSGYRVIHVAPVVMKNDPSEKPDADDISEKTVAYEAEVYNAKGLVTERMACMTQSSSGQPDELVQVVANINGKKGQIGYTASYVHGVRREMMLVRDDGPKSDTFATNSRRLAARNYHLPDERRDTFQAPEGPISLVLYDTCVTIVAEAKKLDANPQANHASVHANGPLETRSYTVPLTPMSPSARSVFLNGGSPYGYFLKELGFK